MLSKKISFSIVSHGQSDLIESLLADLADLALLNIEVIVTVNIPEEMAVYHQSPIPIKIIINEKPKGFGENHNAAFAISSGVFFAVVNPDIRIPSLDLKELLSPFVTARVSVVAPLVFSKCGRIEDSARRFPTFVRFTKRLLFRQYHPDYFFSNKPQAVDWVAGMFIVFRSNTYRLINGFNDRRFFMYLEDADICRRLHLCGWEVLVNPNVHVIHVAQRASRRNLKHMYWHLKSAVRFLTGF